MVDRIDAIPPGGVGAGGAPTGRSRAARRLSRRRFVLAGGAALLGACTSDSSAPIVRPAPGGEPSTAGDPAAATSAAPHQGAAPEVTGPPALTAAQFESLPTCLLLPELASGPFPLDEQFQRSDITEDHPGHPLRLGLRVVTVECAPVPGAAVEVWHADASGDYSAFEDRGGGKDEGPGTTFLRGTQPTDSSGIVEFQTIYPGWYPGRAVHVHLRVRVDGEPVLTSQLFFPDEVTTAVFARGPYAEFGPPDTTNGADRLAGDVAGDGTLLTVTEAVTVTGAGTLALANLGIQPPGP